MNEHRSAQNNTPTPWDYQQRPRTPDSGANSAHRYHNRDSNGTHQRDSREALRERIERLGMGRTSQQHMRNDSGATGGMTSSTDYEAQHSTGGRRHDYDVQSMETDLSGPRSNPAKNPIPPPSVTVRSEFPTLNRSRQQQSLTCLVTVEVPDGKWHPHPDDLRHAPPMPIIQQEDGNIFRDRTNTTGPNRPRERDSPVESQETLDEITEELRLRVDNWHGLEFGRSVCLEAGTLESSY